MCRLQQAVCAATFERQFASQVLECRCWCKARPWGPGAGSVRVDEGVEVGRGVQNDEGLVRVCRGPAEALVNEGLIRALLYGCGFAAKGE